MYVYCEFALFQARPEPYYLVLSVLESIEHPRIESSGEVDFECTVNTVDIH